MGAQGHIVRHIIGHIVEIAELRQRISELERRTSSGRPAPGALPFGLSVIDAALPSGGLACPAVHEITAEGPPSAATLFAAGILARTGGPVLWCLGRRNLFAPGLAGAGLHPDRLILIEAGDRRAVLRAMEEGLRHGGLGAVLGEIDRLGLTESRRLQLAAEAGGALGLVLSHPFAASVAGERQSPNVATTRWRISALSSAPLPVPGIGRPRWRVELLRCRGGAAAEWILEACDAEGRLAVPAAPAEPGRQRAIA